MVRPEDVIGIDLRLHRLEASEGLRPEKALATLAPLGEVEVVAARIPPRQGDLHEFDVSPHRGAHRRCRGNPGREYREAGFEGAEGTVAGSRASKLALEVSHFDR